MDTHDCVKALSQQDVAIIFLIEISIQRQPKKSGSQEVRILSYNNERHCIPYSKSMHQWFQLLRSFSHQKGQNSESFKDSNSYAVMPLSQPCPQMAPGLVFKGKSIPGMFLFSISILNFPKSDVTSSTRGYLSRFLSNQISTCCFLQLQRSQIRPFCCFSSLSFSSE